MLTVPHSIPICWSNLLSCNYWHQSV